MSDQPEAGARRPDEDERAGAAGPPRPLIERLGLGAIALVVAAVFAAVSVAALAGGEVFLAAMAGIGALMTLWAGIATVVRR